MANKFNVGDKVIIKSVNDILGMYESDEQEKVSKNLEDFSDFFNKVGTIRSFFGVVCMVDCGPNCERLIPTDWLEKYDFFNNNKRIINVCKQWDSKKNEKYIPKNDAKSEECKESNKITELFNGTPEEIREFVKNVSANDLMWLTLTFGDSLSDEVYDFLKKIIKEKESRFIKESNDSSFVDTSDEIEDVTDKECTVSDLIDMGIDADLVNGGVEGLKKTAEKMSPMEIDYLRNTFFAELSDDDINEIINKKNERLKNSVSEGAKVINRIKECKLLESSNEMYENTKKELESKRSCESDKKIDGRIELINNAQKDVLERYKKLTEDESSCDFCFEEVRTDVADSTQSFDYTASTISDGILCRMDGIQQYFAENKRLMCHNFLVELPERYGIPCFNIDEFFIDRNDKTVSMTVYEKEDGSIIRKLISELRFGVDNTGRNTDEIDINVYHYNNGLKIAYKEVFRNIKLEKVVDQILSYGGGDEFFAHYVTFRYITDFIEDNDFVPTNASFIIEKHKKMK